MQAQQQLYTPLGSLDLSVTTVVIPIVFLFLALAVFRLKSYIIGSITLALTIAVATFVFHMPADMASAATGYGSLYSLRPIAWIIVTAIFLYRLTVKSGQFEVIRSLVLSITGGQRLQVLLIGFSFEVFLEGTAGFGTPVAIAVTLLVSLGFSPFYAAGLCLITGTAPVTFDTLSTLIIIADQVTGIDALRISAMTGRQLPLLSISVPFWLVFMVDSWRSIRETWPVTIIAGDGSVITQYLTSDFIGPKLPNIISVLVSLVSLTLFLKVWQPQSTSKAPAANGGVTVAGGGYGGRRSVEPSVYNLGEILKAWSPSLVLTVLVTIWTLKPFKALFAPGGELYWLMFNFAIPHLGQLTVRGAPITTSATPVVAVFKFDPTPATGTAIFLPALVSMFILRVGARVGITTFREVLVELRWLILSVGMVLTFAFVTNYSGMSATLALVLAGIGTAFPFFSPSLGWLGVFLTGSDVSSSILFSSLQSTAVHQIGISDTLLVATSTSGGVTGKVISPQPIAMACAATGAVGKESDLFRFTLKYSLTFTALVELITLVQAYLFASMLVH